MKKIKISNYVMLLFALIHLTWSATNSEIHQNEENCFNDLSTLTGNGSLEIPLENNDCLVHVYTISASDKSSIVKVSVTSTSVQDDSEKTLDQADVTINLQELNQENGTDSYTTVESWTLTSKTGLKNIYYSRTLHSRITFTANSIWSGNKVILAYKEIAFDTLYKNSSEDGSKEVKPWLSMEGRSYRPNCVYVYCITKSEEMETSNILITLNYLDIDEEVGEYLLIGAGLSPFEGPPPLFVSHVNGTKQYLVNDENAYVVFVTGSTRRDHMGFSFTWQYSGTKIKVDKEIGKEDVLESVPICIYNISAAMVEFNTTQDWFIDFRKKFALVASEYAKEKRNSSFLPENEDITSSGVSIFRISGVIPVNESHNALYAMIKISKTYEKGKAAFKSYELELIVERYTEQYSKPGADKFQFRKCPERQVPESWGNLSLYLIIPIICFLVLLAWTWKRNPLSGYFTKKKGRHGSSKQEFSSKFYQEDCVTVSKSMTENSYATLPKFQVTGAAGRRYTMNLADTLLSDGDQSDDEIFNKMHTHRRQSNILESQTINKFLSKRPEINHAFTLDEECISELCIEEQKTEHQDEKAEHMYDSVKSSTHVREEEETKL